MNFDFSDDQKFLKGEARKFLEARCPTSKVRAVLDDPAKLATTPASGARWPAQGWLGAAIPEAYGGLGLGHLELCVIAEELGRALAPIPFASTAYFLAEALMLAGLGGAEGQAGCRRSPPARLIGCFATVERPGALTEAQVQARVEGGKLTGTKLPVTDGDIADVAVVLAARGRPARPLPGRARRRRRDARDAADARSHPRRRQADLRRRRGRAAGRGRARAWRWPRRSWSARRCCWRSSRWAAPTGRWRWPRAMRWSATRSAGRSAATRRSSTSWPTCTSRTSWPAPTPTTAPGRWTPARRSCRWRPPRPRVAASRGLLVRRQGEPADPRRHRLHLADGLPPVLPPLAQQLGLVAGGAKAWKERLVQPARTAQRGLRRGETHGLQRHPRRSRLPRRGARLAGGQRPEGRRRATCDGRGRGTG